MTYVDTSVVLAHVLVKDIRPSDAFWALPDLVSSRLAEYEAWERQTEGGADFPEAPIFWRRRFSGGVNEQA